MRSTCVVNELKRQGARRLYHANSVVTACHFLRAASLLSRGTIERRGLFQTRQESDIRDKLFGIWYDVFVDTLDIHATLYCRNLYGPVTLVFDHALVKVSRYVWITRANPVHWVGESNEEEHRKRWLWSEDDLEDQFCAGSWRQSLVFRQCGGEVPFNYHLKEIILDDPKRKRKGVSYYETAHTALTAAMDQGEIDVPIRRRECSGICSCRSEYADDLEMARELFLPSYAMDREKKQMRLRKSLKRKT